jgi:hypothetical protein
MNALNQYLSNSGLLSESSIATLGDHWKKAKRLKPKEALLNFEHYVDNPGGLTRRFRRM